MEEIYKKCDEIILKKRMTEDNLYQLLNTICKSGARRKSKPRDVYMSRASSMNSRAKKKGVEGKVFPSELRNLMEGSCCAKCKTKDYLVFDHIKPLYSNGSNTIDNIQILCRVCNMEKGIRDECF